MSKKNRYQISTRQMLEGISKLKLERGDIIIVKHPDTLKALEALGKIVNFTVPLVYSPIGIEKLSKQDLLNLLEQLEQQEAPAQEHPSHIPA